MMLLQRKVPLKDLDRLTDYPEERKVWRQSFPLKIRPLVAAFRGLLTRQFKRVYGGQA
jgi:hypothetical protein